jgi:CRP/FNR family transcriptional regulator, cyclic AMP receptor protein
VFADTKETMPLPLEPKHPAPLRAALDAHIALLSADTGFAAGIPTADLGLASRVLTLPRLDLDAGTWTPPAPGGFGDAPLALVVDGLLGRHIDMGDRVATQLLGPGDVIDPWRGPGDTLVSRSVHWSAYGPATIAVLDGRFATAAQRWPALSRTLQARLIAQADRLAVDLAICQLPRVGDRIVALLAHLGERFGRMAPDGVVVDVRLTHRLLGELVGAQRPTVSLALTSLLEEGRVGRRPDGTLVVAGAPDGALAPVVVDEPIAA